MAIPIGTGGGSGYGPIAPPLHIKVPGKPGTVPNPFYTNPVNIGNPITGEWVDDPGEWVAEQAGITWADLLNADPDYQQALADITGAENADLLGSKGGMRQALIQMGGSGLAGVVGKLAPDWADLLDATTLAAAQAGDTGGTSISAQLEKAHRDRLLAEEDIRAARGIQRSGQTGFEIGEERQRNTNSVNEAITSLLNQLSGIAGGFSTRKGERVRDRGNALTQARDRLISRGLGPREAKAGYWAKQPGRRWVPIGGS